MEMPQVMTLVASALAGFEFAQWAQRHQSPIDGAEEELRETEHLVQCRP